MRIVASIAIRRHEAHGLARFVTGISPICFMVDMVGNTANHITTIGGNKWDESCQSCKEAHSVVVFERTQFEDFFSTSDAGRWEICNFYVSESEAAGHRVGCARRRTECGGFTVAEVNYIVVADGDRHPK